MRPRTLLAIAALAGAFYFLLPQIADVSSSWHALQHVNWAWLPVIIGLSALTYVASAMALIGSVPGHVPFGPAVLTQGASSFINRVSPANVGGMALNARFLQKSGTSTPASVAAVGVNALAGAVMHVVLIVVFFALAGHDLTQAFKLPSASKILLILAVIIAVIGVVLATRPGRRWTRKQLIPGVRSAAGSLRQAAASPVKLGLLFGGSALITLAYIAGLDASVQAFGGGPGLVVLGAVYLAAAALAAAAPTPGGLGAIEAALVAGLTGVGMQPGPAVSAVLLYRLATYWLPVLPGWLCWRSLQHRDTCDRRPAAGPGRTSAGAGHSGRPRAARPARRRPEKRDPRLRRVRSNLFFSTRTERHESRAGTTDGGVRSLSGAGYRVLRLRLRQRAGWSC